MPALSQHAPAPNWSSFEHGFAYWSHGAGTCTAWAPPLVEMTSPASPEHLLAWQQQEVDGSWWAWVSWVQETGGRHRHKVVRVRAARLRPLEEPEAYKAVQRRVRGLDGQIRDTGWRAAARGGGGLSHASPSARSWRSCSARSFALGLVALFAGALVNESHRIRPLCAWNSPGRRGLTSPHLALYLLVGRTGRARLSFTRPGPLSPLRLHPVGHHDRHVGELHPHPRSPRRRPRFGAALFLDGLPASTFKCRFAVAKHHGSRPAEAVPLTETRFLSFLAGQAVRLIGAVNDREVDARIELGGEFSVTAAIVEADRDDEAALFRDEGVHVRDVVRTPL